MKLACMLTALATSPAFAQSTVTHVDLLTELSYFRAQVGAVVPHPDGGVVSVFRTQTNAPGQRNHVTFRHLNEDADPVWTTEVLLPTPNPAVQIFTVSAIATTRGSTVSILNYSGITRLISVAVDGAVEWESTMRISVPEVNAFSNAQVSAAENGDIYFAGFMDKFAIPAFDGRATVRRLSGTTGIEAWTYERPARFRSGRMVGHFANTGDDAFLVYDGAAGITMTRLDASGQEVYEVIGVGGTLMRPTSFYAQSNLNGELLVALYENQISGLRRHYRLDAAGAVVWEGDFGSTGFVSQVRLMDTGEVLVAGSGLLAGTAGIAKFDASAAVIWATPLDSESSGYGFLVNDDGSATVISRKFVGPGSGFTAEISKIDSDGTILAQENLGNIPETFSNFALPATDTRGNTWFVGSVYQPFGYPRVGLVAKFSTDDLTSTSLCSQSVPNSSGAVGELNATGSGIAATNNLTLVAQELPPQQTVLFLNATSPGFTANAGGSQGNLCLGGIIGRYVGPGEVGQSNAFGFASLLLELPQTPSGGVSISISAGQTWNFQAWHRDVVSGAVTSNFTEAIAVTWL